MKYGIDVSYANGDINWEELKDKIDFAILRIAWIGNKNNSEEDSEYRRNYNECKRLGIPIGGYVYSYCESSEKVIEGAKKVLEITQNDEFELPLFLDLEDQQISYIETEELTDLAIDFCEYIEENSNFKAGVYANLNWFDNHLNKDRLVQNEINLWLAHWDVDSEKYEDTDFMMLQYTDNLNEDGFDGNVLYNEGSSDNTENDNLNIPFRYQNGSSIERVYSDTNLTKEIGYLNPYENVACLGIFNNRALVLYKVDNAKNYKIGFCKWFGGII